MLQHLENGLPLYHSQDVKLVPRHPGLLDFLCHWEGLRQHIRCLRVLEATIHWLVLGQVLADADNLAEGPIDAAPL